MVYPVTYYQKPIANGSTDTKLHPAMFCHSCNIEKIQGKKEMKKVVMICITIFS